MTVFRMPKDVDELVGITEETIKEEEEEEESKSSASWDGDEQSMMSRVIQMLFQG